MQKSHFGVNELPNTRSAISNFHVEQSISGVSLQLYLGYRTAIFPSTIALLDRRRHDYRLLQDVKCECFSKASNYRACLCLLHCHFPCIRHFSVCCQSMLPYHTSPNAASKQIAHGATVTLREPTTSVGRVELIYWCGTPCATSTHRQSSSTEANSTHSLYRSSPLSLYPISPTACITLKKEYRSVLQLGPRLTSPEQPKCVHFATRPAYWS